MKEFKIQKNEAGQRFDKYLSKYMKEAPKSFLYKMMRKKNITLNGKKAVGNEILAQGDTVKLFLSDETIRKFSSNVNVSDNTAVSACGKLDILYEDEHTIFINKPAGMLSQKASPHDVSLVEHLIAYLIRTQQITPEELRTFHPSVCNRLDRNTSGIVAAGKSLSALQKLSMMFRDRTMEKYYLCLIRGEVSEKKKVDGWLIKNEQTNRVIVTKEEIPGGSRIETEYHPIHVSNGLTLMEVHLITGKTHQIRAHLASNALPIVGDYKYGDRNLNDLFKKEYGLKSQFLHAYRLHMPVLDGDLHKLSKKEIKAPLPPLLKKIITEKGFEI